jgi:hypothetical protein
MITVCEEEAAVPDAIQECPRLIHRENALVLGTLEILEQQEGRQEEEAEAYLRQELQ